METKAEVEGRRSLAPHTQGIKTPNEFYNGAVFYRKGFSDETMYSHRNTHLMLPVFDVWTGAERNFEMVKVGVMWYLRKDSWKRVPPFVFAALCPRWKWLGAKFLYNLKRAELFECYLGVDWAVWAMRLFQEDKNRAKVKEI